MLPSHRVGRLVHTVLVARAVCRDVLAVGNTSVRPGHCLTTMSGSRVAVVLGVGPGIGQAAAERFAKEGYAVALLARRLESLDQVKQSIEASGGRAISVPADCSVETSIIEALDKVKQELGNPEVLVYNAGPGVGSSWPPPSIADLSTEDFKQALDVGVTGAFVACKQVLPAMAATGKGTIILTGATASLRGGARFAKLACPKFALRALGQSMAREFGPQGVHVAHLIIDGQVDLETSRKRQPDRAGDTWLSPQGIAESMWSLHTQDKTAWTQELDLRPYCEKW